MVDKIKLRNDFSVSTHAAERYLTRILGRQTYTRSEIGLAKKIIRTLLADRAHDVTYYDSLGKVIISAFDAMFVYNLTARTVLTTLCNQDNYLDQKFPKSKVN